MKSLGSNFAYWDIILTDSASCPKSGKYRVATILHGDSVPNSHVCQRSMYNPAMFCITFCPLLGPKRPTRPRLCINWMYGKYLPPVIITKDHIVKNIKKLVTNSLHILPTSPHGEAVDLLTDQDVKSMLKEEKEFDVD